MREKLRFWNQYGYDVDVFDKYRDSVTRSNQISVKVFSVLAMAVTLIIMVFGFLTKQAETGAIYCFLTLSAGVYGVYVSFQAASVMHLLAIRNASVGDFSTSARAGTFMK